MRIRGSCRFIILIMGHEEVSGKSTIHSMLTHSQTIRPKVSAIILIDVVGVRKAWILGSVSHRSVRTE